MNKMPGRDLNVYSEFFGLANTIIVRRFNDVVRGTFMDRFGGVDRKRSFTVARVIVNFSRSELGTHRPFVIGLATPDLMGPAIDLTANVRVYVVLNASPFISLGTCD